MPWFMKHLLQNSVSPTGDGAGGSGATANAGNPIMGSFPTGPASGSPQPSKDFMDAVLPSASSQQSGQQPPQQQQQNTPPEDPMAEFNKLFTPQPSQQQPQQQQPTAPQDSWAVNADSLRASSKAVGDALTSVLPAEQLQAALQGDTAAFTSILGNVVQLAYMASVQNVMGMAKTAVATQFGQFEQGLQGKFTEFSAQNSIMMDPRAQNPAVRAVLTPMIDAIKTQRPDISAHELSATVGKFLDTLGATLGAAKPGQVPQQQVQQQEQPNWAAILKG